MTNSNELLTKRFNWLNSATIVFLVIAFLGFFDATYLTAEHYLALPLPCTILKGCETVTRSAYSMLGPIPVALLGAAYYMAAFFLMIVYRETNNKKALFAALALTGAGVLASAWFVYVQAAILHAFCQYCILSAIFTLILFTLSATLWFRYSH